MIGRTMSILSLRPFFPGETYPFTHVMHACVTLTIHCELRAHLPSSNPYERQLDRLRLCRKTAPKYEVALPKKECYAMMPAASAQARVVALIKKIQLTCTLSNSQISKEDSTHVVFRLAVIPE